MEAICSAAKARPILGHAGIKNIPNCSLSFSRIPELQNNAQTGTALNLDLREKLLLVQGNLIKKISANTNFFNLSPKFRGFSKTAFYGALDVAIHMT